MTSSNRAAMFPDKVPQNQTREDLGIHSSGPVSEEDIPAWTKRMVAGHERRHTPADQLDDVYWSELEDYIVSRYVARTPDAPHTLKVRQQAQKTIADFRSTAK